jgi:hypothetical protein
MRRREFIALSGAPVGWLRLVKAGRHDSRRSAKAIATYVRDAGVAGSNPATPTIISMTYSFDVPSAQ